MTGVRVIPWPGETPPARNELEEIFRCEGLSAGWWSNAPGDRYGAHAHPYHKVLYCAHGSIRFLLDSDEHVDLTPGDRLEIAPGTRHAALVGPQGVTCIEAARR